MPKYQIIVNAIRNEIERGLYTNGKTLPTEEQLAVQFGVSRQTVRQALSVLVQENLIIKQQGSGSRVKPHHAEPVRSNNIAVITTYISDYIFPSILREAESVLSNNKYTAILAATKNRVDNERSILTEMLSKPIDGFLVEGTKTAMPNPNLDLYRQLMSRHIPIVFFNGYYSDLEGTTAVYADNYGGGYELVKYLLGKGHKRIAGIFKSDDIQGHQRYSGYISALRDTGVLIPDDLVFWYTTESRDQIVSASLVGTLGDATAVVCYNDEVAIRLIQFLVACGKSVPGDVAVVSFDNSSLSYMSPVKITSLSYGNRNIGRVAAEKLISLINGGEAKTETLSWILVEKESG